MSRQAVPDLPVPYDIVGVQLHPLTCAGLCDWIVARMAERRPAAVFYSNVHAVVLAQRHDRFRAAMNAADVVFCDGHGLRLGARLLGLSIPERFTPPDWIDILGDRCAAHGGRWFMLGSAPGVAEAAAKRLRERCPPLEITTHHGYFDLEGPDNDEVCRLIRNAQPDLLLVGMGMPRQELWIQANRGALGVPVVLSVGALFDYLAGHTRRGPAWMTQHGFEWLARLWFEPRRLWRRYLIGNAIFAGLIARERIRRAVR